MLQTQAVWLLIILAITTAGLPFISQRPLICWPWTADVLPEQPLWQRSLLSLVHLLSLCLWAWLTRAWIGDSLPTLPLAALARVLLMVAALAILLGWPTYYIQTQPQTRRKTSKPVLSRLLECLALYALTLTLGFALETQLGNPFPQRWEFYAITLSLYLVPAFPAFVWRYLLRR